MNPNRPLGIGIVAVLMIVFGLAAVGTGFTHNFLGLLSTTSDALATYGAAGIGLLYALGGVLLFPMRRRLALLTLALLALIVVGRVFLVASGLYPTDTPLQTFSIIVGTAIAVIFAVYIRSKLPLFI
jgi:hypothetical protein